MKTLRLRTLSRSITLGFGILVGLSLSPRAAMAQVPDEEDPVVINNIVHPISCFTEIIHGSRVWPFQQTKDTKAT